MEAAATGEKKQAMAAPPAEDPFADFGTMDKQIETLQPAAPAGASADSTAPKSTADIMGLFATANTGQK